MFLWVYPRRQFELCRVFGILCRLHLLGLDVNIFTSSPRRWNRQRLPKRRQSSNGRRGCTQKNRYNSHKLSVGQTFTSVCILRSAGKWAVTLVTTQEKMAIKLACDLTLRRVSNRTSGTEDDRINTSSLRAEPIW